MTPWYMRDVAFDLSAHLRARFPNLEPTYWGGNVHDSSMNYDRRVAMHMAWLLAQVPKLVEEQKRQELAWILGSVQTFLLMTCGLPRPMHLDLRELDGIIQFVQI